MKRTMLLAAMLLTTLLFAQPIVKWQENGIPIRQGENIEWARSADVLTDGNVVYVWSDTKLGDRDVWAQKISPTGEKLWGDSPVLIDNKLDRQEDPVIIATTDGGAIIAWIEFTNEIAGDVYAQKVNSDGELLWADGGEPLCTADGIQLTLNIVPDLNGGAFIIWVDSRNPGGSDIYGVHVNADGENTWTADGVMVAGGEGEQSGHTFWQDGEGGAILAYMNSYLSEKDIYVKHILNDGSIEWTTVLCDEEGDQESVKMCKTGDDTFGFAWRDRRTENDGDIYAQGVDIDGNLLWTNEIVVYAGTGVQENPRVTASSDGGMFVTWQDTRVDGYYTDCYAQKVDASGNLLWNADGVVLCDEEFHQWNTRLVGGDNGDVYVVWDDGRDGGHPHEDIYIQHVLSDGSIDWEEDGREICTADWEQFNVLIKRSADDIFVNWGDFRTGSIGLYLQILDMDGNFELEDNGEEFYWGLSGDATDAVLLQDDENAYAVWIDTRYAVTGSRVFTQKILGDDSGSVGFTTNGIPLTVDVGHKQTSPAAVVGHNGGVMAAWQQLIDGQERVYTGALSEDGSFLWGDSGVALSSKNLNQEFPKINEIDGAYYYGWSNLEQDGWNYYYRLYAQKVVDGAIQWGDEGVEVYSTNADLFMEEIVGPYYLFQTSRDVYVTKLESDGSLAQGFDPPLVLCDAPEIQKNPHGILVDDDLFVIWEDKRDTLLATTLFGQYVSSNGAIEWAENGEPIAVYDNDQYDPALALNGTDVYIAWSDFRDGVAEDVVMQKVATAGDQMQLLWDNNGEFVVEKDSVQFNTSLISVDNMQLITWADFYGPASDIYMQHVDSDGDIAWNANGVPLCNAIMNQYEPHVVPVNNGSDMAIAIWRDARSSGKTEISGMYAQKIWIGYNDVDDNEHVPAAISLEQNWPNPFNPETTIAFSLLNPGDAKLEIYNIRGQKVRSLVNENLPAGRHAFTWQGRDDNGASVASGVYMYRLSSGDQTETRRMILLK